MHLEAELFLFVNKKFWDAKTISQLASNHVDLWSIVAIFIFFRKKTIIAIIYFLPTKIKIIYFEMNSRAIICFQCSILWQLILRSHCGRNQNQILMFLTPSPRRRAIRILRKRREREKKKRNWSVKLFFQTFATLAKNLNIYVQFFIVINHEFQMFLKQGNSVTT